MWPLCPAALAGGALESNPCHRLQLLAYRPPHAEQRTPSAASLPEALPGTGLDVAEFLSLHAPICPVILHPSNFDGRLAMFNQLRAAGWTVATVSPREANWIQVSWLPIAKRLVGL